MSYIPKMNENKAFYTRKQIKIPSFIKKTTQIDRDIHMADKKNEQNDKNSHQIKKNYSSNQSFLNDIIQSNNINENSAETFQYSILNEQINSLHIKISQMKVAIDKKRQQKFSFMQNQKINRASVIPNSQNLFPTNQSAPLKVINQSAFLATNESAPLKRFISQAPQHKQLTLFTQNPYSPRHSVYYVSEIIRAYRIQKSLAREHLISSMEYLKMFQNINQPDQKDIQAKMLNLPRMKGYEDKKTVVFDLDETLIHCNEDSSVDSDVKMQIKFPTGELGTVGINVRPYAKQMLAALSKNFQIIVFTASHSCYANIVLDYLDPQQCHIHHRLFRQHCHLTPQGIYVKDLRILNRPLSKTILIDNAAYSYGFQPLNGVPIIPYYEGKNDYQLAALQKYVQTLMFSYDVRDKNRQTFKINRYCQFFDIRSLVDKLYIGR